MKVTQLNTTLSDAMRTMAIITCIGLACTPVWADRNDDNDEDDDDNRHIAFCSDTAKLASKACDSEREDDYLIARGICINIADKSDRKDCRTEARALRKETKTLCKEQYKARLELCDLVGEQRYDPEFDPDDFIDPLQIGSSIEPNPYLPFIPGNRWVYESTFIDEEGEQVTETVTVTVTDKTKLIDGVTCLVVRDLVEVDGEPLEDTNDWFAQDVDGNVWYCGEEVKDYEVFEGDDPAEAELISIEGSFKAGRDGDKAGIQMLFDPQAGDVYRQEFSLGNAEDAAEVISISGTESVPATGCDGTCLVTREFTPTEPGLDANKYYAPGIGLMLEISAEGDRLELIEFSTP